MRWLRRKVLRAFWTMMCHTIRRTALGRRGIAILCVGLTPAVGILIASMAQHAAVSESAEEIYTVGMSYVLLAFFAPLAALLLFGSIIREDVERGTAPYIFTRALPRPLIFLAQYRANAVVLILIFVITALSFHLILRWRTAAQVPLRTLAAYLLGGALATLSYGAIFAILAALTRRTMILGFMFVGYETVLGSEVSALNRITLTYYLRSLVYRVAASPDLSLRRAARHADLLPAILVIAALTLLTVALAMTVCAFKEFHVRRPD